MAKRASQGGGAAVRAGQSLTGFHVRPEADGFVMHIVDDRDEVFEIGGSRAHLDLIIRELRAALGPAPAPDGDSL